MATKKLTGKDLRALGYPEGRLIGTAIRLLESEYKGKSRQFKIELMEKVIRNPALYQKHEHLGILATEILVRPEKREKVELNKGRLPYRIFGAEVIEPGALHQMELAMKLPITVAGALMPDAHQGYGLPIGGVLATKNAVIPYGVGMDIGCRMCMTIYDLPTAFHRPEVQRFRKILNDQTRFGHAAFNHPKDDAVMERKEFREIQLLRSLKDRAYQQIGTSGGGNHFVEFGITRILEKENEFNLPAGKYLAVLSHSGSRGMGAEIARHYTRLAMENCILPAEAKHLAWLDLDSEAGQEYWMAMNLAGDYASANHHHIHDRIAESLGEKPLVLLENHHNFAWKEHNDEGNEMIVHRKGATPAGKGDIGIIPGSMTAPGFIVRGKGNADSINSASHGAGRVMSRRKAKSTICKQDVLDHLKKTGTDVIGSGLDEAPMVYKDIYKVMEYQQDLVEILGKFTPKVVRMCGDARFQEVD
jgi:tRNA-splicing ligase RtcB